MQSIQQIYKINQLISFFFTILTYFVYSKFIPSVLKIFFLKVLVVNCDNQLLQEKVMDITFTFASLGLKSYRQRNNTVILYLRDVWNRKLVSFSNIYRVFQEKATTFFLKMFAGHITLNCYFHNIFQVADYSQQLFY